MINNVQGYTTARFSKRRKRRRPVIQPGRHPDGFDTCAYDPAALAELTGVSVEPIALPQLFAAAAAVTPTAESSTPTSMGMKISRRRNCLALSEITQSEY